MLPLETLIIMKQAYEVRFHTGDSWGRGCASIVAFQVYGSQYNLSSEACVQQELPPVNVKRSRAVQFAVAKARKDRGEAAYGAAAGPPPEKRNVFALMSNWLETAGGAVQVKQLLKVVDEGGDGVLAIEEVKQLLSQAVPAVSDLETQLFIAMVDTNGDEVLTERELLQSIGDCAGIDVAVASGGSGPGPVQDPGAPPDGASGPKGDIATALGPAIQHLRSNVGLVNAKLLEMNPPGGYLTYGQLNELLQAVVPESLGGRATIRALMAHVARTANISALDPGIHVLEMKRCFGIMEATLTTGASAAVAAGWVPGRPRDIFKLLRYHVKHNRAQLDGLFPRGLELTANQVRHLVRQLLDTRTGEPPLTGREARHLVAVLDVNANGTLSREEFDKGLRECRDISAAMAAVYGRGLDLASLQLDAPLYPSVTGEGKVAPPTWGAFRDALQQLHQVLADHPDEAEAAWRRNDSRGKGRIDACELHKVLLELAPGSLSVPLLRAVLIYLDGWDPSEHALLSRKHLLKALRGDRPPDNLQPQPVMPMVGAGEGVTATTPPLRGISQGITQALYGGDVDAGLRGLLPDPAQWQEWHGNVKTPERLSGSVTLGGGLGQLPRRPGFWKAQWKCHTAWLAANAAYRQGAADSPAAGPGVEQGPAAAAAAAAVAPLSSSTTDKAAASGDSPPNNCLECRLWPPVSVAALPYIRAVYGNELAAWKRAAEATPEQQGDEGMGAKPAVSGASIAPAPLGPGGHRVKGPVAEAVEGDGAGEGSQRRDDAAALGSDPAAPAAQTGSHVQEGQSALEGKELPTPGEPAGMARETHAGASVPGENTSEANVVREAALTTLSEDVSAPEPSVTPPQHSATPAEVVERPAAAGDGAGSPSSPGELLQRPTDEITTEQRLAAEPVDVLGPEAGGLPESYVPAPAAAAELAMTAAAAQEQPKEPIPEAAVSDMTIAAVSSSSAAPPVAIAVLSDASEPRGASSSGALPVLGGGDPVPMAAAPRSVQRFPQTLSAVEPSHLFQAPPGLVPARVLSYKAILAGGAQLGNVESVSVEASTHDPAWYLDKVEVFCPTSEPALMWEVTVRRWLQPGEKLTGLRPDPTAWEEWDMQVGDNPGAPAGRVLFLNRNLGEVSWTAPPRTPLPALPGALPNLRLTGDKQTSLSSGQQGGEWLGALTPNAVPRNNVRFLDNLRGPPVFRPTRVRATYDLGFDGELDIVPGKEVRVRGERCIHSISVMARGGFKVVDPDDPNAARLLPVGGAYAGTGSKGGGGTAGRSNASAGSVVDLLGGAVFPGVRECVVLSYALDAAADELGEKYMWLDGWVALDDSAGTPPAPVRFSVVKDGALAWTKWVRAAGEVHRCCVPVVGCRELHLVVESDFSGGARAVWLDPFLLCGPLHDKALIASLESAARANEVDCSTGDIKVSFVTEDGGAIMYMAPAQSVPTEVSRSSSTANYRISLFTGPEKNGGTRGKVYLRLQGWRGSGANRKAVKSNLICINPDGMALKEGDKYALLEPLTLPWMDEVECVVLQHVPAPSGLLGGSNAVGGPNDWNVQHVELSCDETGRTWYFVAGGWFLELAGRQAEERGGPRVAAAQMELMLPRVTSPSQLKVVFHIISSGKGVGMGIDGDLEMVLVGVDASGYQYASMSLPGRSIDSSHETRLLESPLALGDLQTLELSCKQQGLLRTRLQCIEVVRLVDAKHFLFLAPSLDPGETPEPAATTRLILKAATQPYFRISTFTSAIAEASTDARIYIDLFGSRGKLLDLYLRDATGDSFNEGCEDVFFFPDPGLGDLGSVCISHDDSGESPNWHLDRVEITNTGTGRTNVFVCKQWIGLGTNRQDENQLEGRFGPDRVLERVLYPTHVLMALKNGTPLLRYHVIFHTNNARVKLCNTAEALQLVGKQADGGFQFSELVILDSGRSDMDLELDMQYVRHIQTASRIEAQRGLEDRDIPLPATAVVGGSANVRRIFQVVLKKLALFEARANIVLQGRLGARQLALVLHGSYDSSRPIILGADNCTSTGMLPFTNQVDDVFQVSCDTQLGTQLLRVDVQLPSNHAPPDWGILLESVTIREVSDASGRPTEFFAGSRGQWVGASPDTPEGVMGGTQALHLLPAGCCAVSFLGRALQELVAMHLRHDSPAPQSGGDLHHIEVLVSPPAGSPLRGDVGMAGAASVETMAPQQIGRQPSIIISPCLYHFPGSPQQPCASWPSTEAPFIRHFLADKCLLQPFPPQAYFKAPLIASPQWHESQSPAPGLDEVQEGGSVGPAPIDAVAMAALKVTQQPDPERLQALADEYRAEVAAYVQSLTGPGAPGTDVFTLMRARIRAEPGLLPSEFNKLDNDKDGSLSPAQVHDLIPHLLPEEVHCSEQLSKYISAMLTLGSGEMMTQGHIVLTLKACRSAYKEAASMVHMLQDGSIDWYQVAQEDGLGVEMALCRLAEQLVQPTNVQAAQEAFQLYDTDGSGYLDIGELCKALQLIPDMHVSSREIRLLLAYLFHFGDKDKDLRLSVLELQASLAPFVPRPPVEELERAFRTYEILHNLPALLRVVNKLQPALFPAACAKAKASAATVGSTYNGAPNKDIDSVLLSLLPDIIAAVVPGWCQLHWRSMNL
ncbi:hypothetical protein Vretimale_9983 [Volvox reticuliferus]|uniref:Uncharacterized protein n=1 Tax=Volvox reticuliferus TaxID=1737510 RepID=A0A8J4GEJ8_9CHLO|nr:hypothetical protein Vretimale_9983 [Volvox reticuliferus]